MPTLRTKKELALLQVLSTVNPVELKSIIHFLDNRAIDIICESIYNILYVKHNVKPKLKKKLQEQLAGKEKIFKTLAKKSNNIQRRRKLLEQNGGWVASLIAAATPILFELVYSALKK